MQYLIFAYLTLASFLPSARAEDRTLQHSGVIHAPASEIWKQFQTGDGIEKIWGVAHADVDFKVGGQIRTTYNAAGKLGDEGTITNTIIAYEPERMLALKSGAPENAPDYIKAICESGWTVLRFEPLSPNSTQVTITGMGYKNGELYDKAYAFFKEGNAYSLEKMKDALEPANFQKTTDAVGAAVKSLVGSWEFSQPTKDGGVFRGKTVIEPLFGGRVIYAKGFLGNDHEISQHSHLTAAKDPRSGEWTFWNFNETGAFTVGPCRLEGDKKLVVDWNTYEDGGRLFDYRIEYDFIDNDNFNLRVMSPPEKDGSRGTIASVHYKRVPTPSTEKTASTK